MSFFCHSKVRETDVTLKISGELFGMILLHLWKRTFLTQSVFVLLSPFTSEYSHDLMQKKKAKTCNQDMLISLRSADFSNQLSIILCR